MILSAKVIIIVRLKNCLIMIIINYVLRKYLAEIFQQIGTTTNLIFCIELTPV